MKHVFAAVLAAACVVETRTGRAHGTRTDADSQTAVDSVNNAYLAAKNPWLQRQFHTPLGLGDLPFVVGRGPVAWEGLPPLQPDLKLDDTVPFRLTGIIMCATSAARLERSSTASPSAISAVMMRHCERERMK